MWLRAPARTRPLNLWIWSVIVGRFLIVEKVGISFCVLLLVRLAPRPDVCVRWGVIFCFVRRIYEDTLCLRFHGRVSFWRITVATATGAWISARFSVETHIWLSPSRRRMVIFRQVGIILLRCVSWDRMPDGRSLRRRIAFMSWMSRAPRRRRRCLRFGLGYKVWGIRVITRWRTLRRGRRGGFVFVTDVARLRNGESIHVESWRDSHEMRFRKLCTRSFWSPILVWTRKFDGGVVRSCPSSWMVSMAKEEKGRTLTLSLKHSLVVGRCRYKSWGAGVSTTMGFVKPRDLNRKRWKCWL